MRLTNAFFANHAEVVDDMLNVTGGCWTSTTVADGATAFAVMCCQRNGGFNTVGNGDAVLHNAFRDLHQDAVGAVTRVQFGACQAAGHQRDDDDRDQDDRLPVEESPAAPLLGRRWLSLGRRGRRCSAMRWRWGRR